MLIKPMKTLIRKELREHYATAAWVVGLGGAALLLAAISVAVTVMIGEDPAFTTPTLLALVQYPSFTAATVAGSVGVIACSGAFATDGAPVTGVFMATQPVHRMSTIAAKYVSIGALIGAAFIIALIVGAVTEAALRLPPLERVDSAEWTFSAARDLPKMLASGVGLFLAAMALSMVPVSRLLAVVLCSFLAVFTKWPILVLAVVRYRVTGVWGPDTVAYVIAAALAPALTFLVAVYVVHVPVPLLERSTRLNRGLLALLIVPPATVIVVELLAALVIAIQSMLV
ncbi:MAG TPA: hypothetical protein DGT21_20480 [Armatimonadetes bacterium]|jgi:hypothetical protein|nr:hypothetical protein [Armatimonadota bacterium]